ncbi:MAG: hypothetical protein ACE5EO_10200 [Candidatus Krumholzibacteriia bacterium]
MTRSPQLALDFAPAGPQGAGGFTPTRPLAKHRYCNGLLRKLHYVRRFFPEFGDRTLRVGLTRAASGMAVAGGNEVWFNPAQASLHTIAHEFVHLLQGAAGVPAGERACDLFSLARDWTLNDSVPCYVRVPAQFQDMWGNIAPRNAQLICDVARRAVELRGAGLRTYVAHFEKTLCDLALDPGGV